MRIRRRLALYGDRRRARSGPACSSWCSPGSSRAACPTTRTARWRISPRGAPRRPRPPGAGSGADAPLLVADLAHRRRAVRRAWSTRRARSGTRRRRSTARRSRIPAAVTLEALETGASAATATSGGVEIAARGRLRSARARPGAWPWPASRRGSSPSSSPAFRRVPVDRVPRHRDRRGDRVLAGHGPRAAAARSPSPRPPTRSRRPATCRAACRRRRAGTRSGRSRRASTRCSTGWRRRRRGSPRRSRPSAGSSPTRRTSSGRRSPRSGRARSSCASSPTRRPTDRGGGAGRRRSPSRSGWAPSSTGLLLLARSDAGLQGTPAPVDLAGLAVEAAQRYRRAGRDVRAVGSGRGRGGRGSRRARPARREPGRERDPAWRRRGPGRRPAGGRPRRCSVSRTVARASRRGARRASSSASRGSTRARSGPGTGLGLAIARSIAVAHGGSIAAANREGGGAIVTVRLPARVGAGLHRTLIRGSCAASSLPPRRLPRMDTHDPRLATSSGRCSSSRPRTFVAGIVEALVFGAVLGPSGLTGAALGAACHGRACSSRGRASPAGGRRGSLVVLEGAIVAGWVVRAAARRRARRRSCRRRWPGSPGSSCRSRRSRSPGRSPARPPPRRGGRGGVSSRRHRPRAGWSHERRLARPAAGRDAVPLDHGAEGMAAGGSPMYDDRPRPPPGAAGVRGRPARWGGGSHGSPERDVRARPGRGRRLPATPGRPRARRLAAGRRRARARRADARARATARRACASRSSPTRRSSRSRSAASSSADGGARWAIIGLGGALVAYVGALLGGEAPDQAALAVQGLELLALALVVAPRRGVALARCAAGPSAVIGLVGAAVVGAWVGAFRGATPAERGEAPAPAAMETGHDHGLAPPPGTVMPRRRGPRAHTRRGRGRPRAPRAARRPASPVRGPAAARAAGYEIPDVRPRPRHPRRQRRPTSTTAASSTRIGPRTSSTRDGPDGLVLLGAMFTMPSMDAAGPTIGGPLTVWHAHEHICLGLLPPGLAGIQSPLGGCPAGSVDFPRTGEMIHAWIIPGAPAFGDLPDDAPAGLARDLRRCADHEFSVLTEHSERSTFRPS